MFINKYREGKNKNNLQDNQPINPTLYIPKFWAKKKKKKSQLKPWQTFDLKYSKPMIKKSLSYHESKTKQKAEEFSFPDWFSPTGSPLNLSLPPSAHPKKAPNCPNTSNHMF